MFVFIKSLILSLFIFSISYASSLQEEAYFIADKDSTYVIEKNNDNRSSRIDQYNRNVNIPLGSPYCASSLYTFFLEASIIKGVKNPLYKTGATRIIMGKALSNPMRFRIIKPSNVLKGSEKLQLGDIVLFSTSPGFTHGHTEFLVEQLDNKTTHNIGGNTTGSDILSEQREQNKNSKNLGGVKHKKREITINNPSWETKAYIRIRNNYEER